MDRELPVSVWPEWKIIEKIGEGSFGRVYKAQRTEKGRSFYSAIKIITIPGNRGEWNSVYSETHDEVATRKYFENLVEECIQEISTMEYFRGNSHIVSVEDFKVVEYLDEVGWEISIRMEYLTSFLDYCESKRLTEKEVIKLGIDLCKALEYCGQQHIIHRDIKPENIFISRFGDFKLGDFGIARELERTMSSYSKKGTYSYMAPEMYRGEAYDIRVDVYSLGVVLYKLLNRNRLPFLNLEKQLITYRDKENALTRRMSGERFPYPVDASRNLAKVILKACSYDPEERYQHPAIFRNDLEALLRGENLGKERRVEKKSQEKAKKERSKKDNQSISLLGIAVIIMAVATCVLTGIYVSLLLEDRVARQTQEMVNTLKDEEYELTEESGSNFAEAVETIKKRATTIVDELESYTIEGEEGEKLLYYNKEGKLMKALIYPSLSADGMYEEYYYWDEQLFFAYIWLDKASELYYYENGNLIRWIDAEGVSHDNEEDNEEYMERSDRYWSNSVAQLP